MMMVMMMMTMIMMMLMMIMMMVMMMTMVMKMMMMMMQEGEPLTAMTQHRRHVFCPLTGLELGLVGFKLGVLGPCMAPS
eukprot:12427676-Karenia_brevis.AAC.1